MPSVVHTSPLRVWLLPPRLQVAGPVFVFAAAMVAHLWPQWSGNPDLSHGLFMPFVFAGLLVEAGRHGTKRWLREGPLLLSAQAGSLVAATLSLAVAGLLSTSLGWTHPLVSFVLTASFAAVMLAALLVLSSARLRALPFNWTSLTAILLWLLCTPLPHGTYMRLTLHLQAFVTGGVLKALHLFGIPSVRHGNIIELAAGNVGIEDACSGIRSLLSCVFVGFVFAAWQVRRPVARATIILLSPLLAVGMNYLRSLTLTLLANTGTEITGFWHDATGYAILGVTTVLLGLLALALSPRSPTPAPVESATAAQASRTDTGVFLAGSALLAGIGLFFIIATHAPPPPTDTDADVAAYLPASADGWRVETEDDIRRFSGVLQTSDLVERSYLKEGSTALVSVYIAHWAAGQAPVSTVAAHTPDACWPGSGWTPLPVASPQVSLTLAGRMLPRAEYRLFDALGQPVQYVWFWHVHNGRVINYRDPYSVPALLELAFRYGFSRDGDQYFVRVSSNMPWERISGEPLVQEVFANLARAGLRP